MRTACYNRFARGRRHLVNKIKRESEDELERKGDPREEYPGEKIQDIDVSLSQADS